MERTDIDLDSEISYTFARSGGKGGQGVNKVATKAFLWFNVGASNILSDTQKELIATKLARYINQEGVLHLSADNTRSQLKNKEAVRTRFYTLITTAFIRPKKRKKTKIPRSVKERRLKDKRMKSQKKQNRKSDGWD